MSIFIIRLPQTTEKILLISLLTSYDISFNIVLSVLLTSYDISYDVLTFHMRVGINDLVNFTSVTRAHTRGGAHGPVPPPHTNSGGTPSRRGHT